MRVLSRGLSDALDKYFDNSCRKIPNRLPLTLCPVELLKSRGFLLRDSVQFHWHNQGFQSFEYFLSALTMKRRKNIRRERKQVLREGISFRQVPHAIAEIECVQTRDDSRSEGFLRPQS